MHRDRNTR